MYMTTMQSCQGARRRLQLRSRRLATIATTTLILAAAPVITSAPASATVLNPTLNCQAESFPPAGTPRNSPGAPFKAPFAATLNGGSLSIHVPGKVGVTFGQPDPLNGYPDGTLFGEACGRLTLPSLQGPIADDHPGAPDNNPGYNHNFILHGPPPGKSSVPVDFPVCDFRYVRTTDKDPTTTGCNVNQPVPVGLTFPGIPGVTLLDGYGSADGTINTAIISPVAANGGFNVSFTNTAKATAVIDPTKLLTVFGGPALAMLPPDLRGVLAQLSTQLTAGSPSGGECTLAVGDLSQTGLNASPTPPVKLSTSNPGGRPVTGPASAGIKAINPVTAGQAVAFANDFPASAIDPNMPPDPGAPNAAMPPATLCNPAIAGLLNQLLGLPASPGDVTFSAPVGFSAHAPQ
ncbi:MAG: hypothetical protein M3137_04035 [Actinomycetota bacterium]|nr:hypothetical protein [Actinomycetota bacterium]